MERYNYLEAVTNDVLDYIDENIDEFRDKFFDGCNGDRYDFADWLRECIERDNFITEVGFVSLVDVEKYLYHNFDLLSEAALATGNDRCIIGGADECDATIRRYLLPQAIDAALDRSPAFNPPIEE